MRNAAAVNPKPQQDCAAYFGLPAPFCHGGDSCHPDSVPEYAAVRLLCFSPRLAPTVYSERQKVGTCV